MLIQPKIRGFICTTAHPIGCESNVLEQINYVKAQKKLTGPKNVLIIGASTGYGLASRITAAFGGGASTIGVFYERAGNGKPASPGWYNSAAFESFAQASGLYAKSINGDAFSQEVKERVATLIKQDLGKIDLIIYSVASPKRVHPETGVAHSSVLKPIGQTFKGKTVDAFRGEVKEVAIEPATPDEIENTIAVMGGDDWERWIKFLAEQDLLAEGVNTVAYSYIGPEITYAIYKNGTIGKAKEDLKATEKRINQLLSGLHGHAVISVNKAVVTQASAAIPVVPLYISILFKVMKEKNLHEGCIEQIYRLFADYLYAAQPLLKDSEDNIRLDDLEMRADVQQAVMALWPQVTSENVHVLTDIAGYCDDFYRLFGFKMAGVDYVVDVDVDVKIKSLIEE